MRKTVRKILVKSAYSLLSAGVGISSEKADSISGFFERMYLRDVLRKFGINCVFDVGANDGGFARLLRGIGYRGHIISFEPAKDEFLSLTHYFEQDPHWRGMNVALGSLASVQKFNLTRNSLKNSFLTPVRAAVRDCYEVEVKRLDEIYKEITSDIEEPRVFLKLDTQGYDLEVIKGAEACIEDVLLLQSEISVSPIYYNMPHFLEALSTYESLGFQLMDLFTVNRNSKLGNIVEYDCLMARLNKL